MIKQLKRILGFKNEEFESLSEFNEGGLKIRVWRSEKTLSNAVLPDRRDLAQSVQALFENRPAPTVAEIMRTLMAKEGVACVAVVDQSGNGASAYPDWH